MLAIFVQRDDLNRNVPGLGFCLSWLSTVQPSMSGRKTSSETAVGLIFLRQRQRFRAPAWRQHLEALVAREIGDDARIMRIVLDDQQNLVVRVMSSRSSRVCSGDLLRVAGGERRAIGERAAVFSFAPASTGPT